MYLSESRNHGFTVNNIYECQYHVKLLIKAIMLKKQRHIYYIISHFSFSSNYSYYNFNIHKKYDQSSLVFSLLLWKEKKKCYVWQAWKKMTLKMTSMSLNIFGTFFVVVDCESSADPVPLFTLSFSPPLRVNVKSISISLFASPSTSASFSASSVSPFTFLDAWKAGLEDDWINLETNITDKDGNNTTNNMSRY